MYSDPAWVEEVAKRGEAIYQEQIKPLVDPLYFGEFLVVDVDTGDYGDWQTYDNRLQETARAQARGNYLCVRVGFLAAYRMGGRNQVPDHDNREG